MKGASDRARLGRGPLRATSAPPPRTPVPIQMLRAAYLIPLALACGTPAPTAKPLGAPSAAPVRAAPPRAAAAGASANRQGSTAGLPGPGQDRDARRRELEQLVALFTRERVYEKVRDLIAQLEELKIEPQINSARASLSKGRPAEALATVEQVLLEAPNGPTARMVHAEASFQVGRDPFDPARLEAAIASFLMAGDSAPRWMSRDERREFRARALLGASRAATVLGEPEQALEHARSCLEIVRSLGTGEGVRNRLPEWPEKRLFDAAFDVYVQVRSTDGGRAKRLAAEMEAALRHPLARNPGAVWPFTSLASLQLGEQRFGEARETALLGLQRHPADLTLPGQLTEAARNLGGSDGVHAALALVKERSPSAALPWWYSAMERFETAADNLGEAPIEEFRLAEADFRRCRDLQPEYRGDCLGYEARCRSAVGWTLLGNGRLAAARDAFLSMEELFPGALRSELPSVLPSGIDGLDRVGQELFERDDLEAAAGIYEELHAYEPSNLTWARESGRLHRDAGARLAVRAEAARRMSSNPGRDVRRATELLEEAGVPVPPPLDAGGTSADWQAALARVDVLLSKRAERMFATSLEAHRAAVALAPEDVRTLVDATIIPIHHGHGELDWAEQTLLRAVELGREQLASDDLPGERRTALTQAYGDAHQNLGVLAFDHRNDLAAARRWFEESLAIGPYPRPIVEEDYLPRCTADGSARNEE